MLKRLILVAAASAMVALAAACSSSGSSNDAAATQPPANNDAAATSAQAEPAGYVHPELLAQTDWLNSELGKSDVIIVDLRKQEDYAAGHIPGAVWYDASNLKGSTDKVHVIDEAEFAKLAGDIGISESDTVVAYDDNAGLSSTRFWWVLSYYGNEQGKVLDGGWPKWVKDALPVSKDAPTVQTAVFKPSIQGSLICKLDTVQDVSQEDDPNHVILDVRSAAEYNGSDVRAARGGHIPNAINLDWTRSMTDSTPQVWKPADQLAKQFSDAGLTKDMEIVTYCQTGVRAAHSLFTLKLMGYSDVQNYDGSWNEYGNSKDTTIEQ